MKTINEMLDNIANTKIQSVLESMLPSNGKVVLSEGFAQYSPPKHFKRTIGRIAIVNRVRNGQVQMNKKVDIMGKGYRLLPSGQVIKMAPREILVRKQSAKRAARKRQMEMASIVRKRMMSIRRRHSQMGM